MSVYVRLLLVCSDYYKLSEDRSSYVSLVQVNSD
jgi:hypothetical protein